MYRCEQVVHSQEIYLFGKHRSQEIQCHFKETPSLCLKKSIMYHSIISRIPQYHISLAGAIVFPSTT